MVLMMVSFHFAVYPPVTTHTPAGTIKVETWVEPHYGLYSFVLATIFSLALTHVIVRCHRIDTEDKQVAHVDDDKFDKQSLLAYSRKYHARGSTLMLLLVPLIVAALVLVVVGESIPSFGFEFKGAFGLLLKLLEEPTSSTYSVMSLGHLMPSSSYDPTSVGIIFLQVTFFLFVVVAPILYLILLIALLLVPLTLRAQRRLLYVTEVVQAWAGLEVFVLSVIASLLELRQFSQFIIGHKCDLVNDYIEKYAGDDLGGDNKCFDVETSLKSGCWVLFAACLMYLFAGIVVFKRCHHALENRGKEAMKMVHIVN